MAGIPRTGKWIFLLLLIAAVVLCFFFLRQNQGAAVRYSLRIGIVAISLAAWFTSQSLIGSRDLRSGAITDAVHELTSSAHRYLQSRPGVANAVLIASSAFIDLFGIFLIVVSILGPTMQPFVALLILFMMRQVCQIVCALPAPGDMIWRDPGFPSLLVTYNVGNDFFFSGHTSIAVLGAIVIAHMFPWWIGAIAAVIAVLEAVVVLVLRAHYTIDIFGAVIAAFCAAGLAGQLCS
jgi:membrane-associated phospholipid phosphatase